MKAQHTISFSFVEVRGVQVPFRVQSLINEPSRIWTENAVVDSERVSNRSEYQRSAIDESCKFSDNFKMLVLYEF